MIREGRMRFWTEHKRIMTVQEFSESIRKHKCPVFNAAPAVNNGSCVDLQSNVMLMSLGLDKPKYLP